MSTEMSPNLDSIDIRIMLKAIPQEITSYKVSEALMYNLSDIQNSLITHQNEEESQAFEYYDKLNSRRVANIKECMLTQASRSGRM